VFRELVKQTDSATNKHSGLSGSELTMHCYICICTIWRYL